MILGTQRNLNRSEHIEVYLDQKLVQLVKKQNSLGVIIDDTLPWDDCCIVVALLFYVHGKHLRSCRDGQLT